MSEESLLQQVERLFTRFGRESLTILERDEPIAGRSFEAWEYACANCIVRWRKDILLTNEELSLYGYIMWSLDVIVREFCPCADGNFAEHLLRIMMVDYLGELAASFPTSRFTLKGLLGEDHFDDDTPSHFYSISHVELLADLERFYAVSYERFTHWKKEYPDAHVLREEMERDCTRYREWVTCFERFSSCQVVRINYLGEYEGNSDWYSEMSMYVIDSGERLWILTLSDYA